MQELHLTLLRSSPISLSSHCFVRQHWRGLPPSHTQAGRHFRRHGRPVRLLSADVASQRSAAQGTRVFFAGSCRSVFSWCGSTRISSSRYTCFSLDRVVVYLVDVVLQRSAAQGTRVFLDGSCRSVFSWCRSTKISSSRYTCVLGWIVS